MMELGGEGIWGEEVLYVGVQDRSNIYEGFGEGLFAPKLRNAGGLGGDLRVLT